MGIQWLQESCQDIGGLINATSVSIDCSTEEVLSNKRMVVKICFNAFACSKSRIECCREWYAQSEVQKPVYHIYLWNTILLRCVACIDRLIEDRCDLYLRESLLQALVTPDQVRTCDERLEKIHQQSITGRCTRIHTSAFICISVERLNANLRTKPKTPCCQNDAWLA